MGVIVDYQGLAVRVTDERLAHILTILKWSVLRRRFQKL